MRSLLGRSRSTGVEVRANPFENPAMPLTSVGLLTLFGGTPTEAGVSVSEENSFSTATFWRAAMTISNLVAGFPLSVFQNPGKTPVLVPALSTPATGTPFEQWETAMLHLLVWGNCYMQKMRDSLGRIVDLVPIYPSRVTIHTVEDPSIPNGTVKLFTIAGAPDNPYTTFEIMHIPGPSTDGVRGIGVVEVARQSLGTGKAADLMAAKQFGNGALIGGMLTTDRILKENEAMSIKERWRETLAGVRHAHDVFVAGSGTKFQPLTMSNEDAQFLASRTWQALEVCRWFGLPPHLAMLVDKSTSWGTGIEQQNIGLLKFTVRPWTYRIEQRVTLEIVGPSNQYAEFQTDDLLRADTVTRYQAYQFAILNGWMTRNEVRAKESMSPLEGLDVPLVPTVAPPAIAPSAPEDTDPDDAADASVPTDPEQTP